jgi:TalC/MipB family fructose-6-phosphate aldolase
MVEALGESADKIVETAKKYIDAGLIKSKTTFKIPITNEGLKVVKILKSEGYKTNLHLVYNVQQLYLACNAGSDYVCILCGRMEDEGLNALEFIKASQEIIHKYNFNSKLMFSSVRNVKHISDALNIGVQACTVPYNVLTKMVESTLTDKGICTFNEDMEKINGR